MRVLTKSVPLILVLMSGWSFGQGRSSPSGKSEGPPPKGAEPVKPIEPGKQTLEELIAMALRNNPDIQAAESKVREAEAELRRARVIVALNVAAKKAAVDPQRQLVAAANEEYQMYLNLWKRGSGSESDMRRSQAGLQSAKMQLAQAEAALETAVGVLPGPLAGTVKEPGREPTGGVPGFRGAVGGAGTGKAGAPGLGTGGVGLATEGPYRVPRGPMAEKIHKALDNPVTLTNLSGVPLRDVIAYLRDAAGVPILANIGDKANEKVSISLKGEISLAAALQALQDVVPGLQCYVREYGILVTLDDGAPSDGMPLIDFWHRKGDTGGPKK